MTARWHILADDLTGALDTAAAFTGGGELPVFWDTVQATAAPVAGAVTASRDVDLRLLADRLAAWLPWFTAADHAFKKVDSLTRGNTFAEVAWLARCGAFDTIVFAPAFPEQGRLTQGGLHRAGAAQVDLLQGFAAEGLEACVWTVGNSSLSKEGRERSQSRIAQVLVPDVANAADLATLASLSTQPVARRWLWCGSAGLAWAISRHWRLAPVSASWPRARLPVVVATASAHPVLRAQLDALAERGFTITGSASSQTDRTVTVIDLAAAAFLQPHAADAFLSARAALVCSGVRPGLLVAIGGDTLLALCRAAEVHFLAAGAAPRAGWGSSRLVGGSWDGLSCLSRSGAFGRRDDLTTLLEYLVPHESHV